MIDRDIQFRSLSEAVEAARQRGFVGVVLDGYDLKAATGAEDDLPTLQKAFDIAWAALERPWAELFARRICDLDRGATARTQLASVLAATGQCREASEIMAGVESHDVAARTVMAVIRAKEGMTAEAFELFDGLPGGGDKYPPAVVLSTVQDMIEQCPLDYTRACVDRLVNRYPDHVLVASLDIRCRLYAGDPRLPADLLKYSVRSFQNAPEFERRAFIEAVADSYALLGWASELFDFAREKLKADPIHWSLYARASGAARETGRAKEFSELMAAIPDDARHQAGARWIICQQAIDENRKDEGLRLLQQLKSESPYLYLESFLCYALFEGDPDKVDGAYALCEACAIPMLGPAVAWGLQSYHYDFSIERIRACVSLLDRLGLSHSKNPHAWQLYMRCLVALNEDREAESIYRALPAGLARSETLAPFGMYFDVVNGRHEAAEQGWKKFIRSVRHPSVNARSSYPKTVQLNFDGARDAVLLFSTVVNAMDYVDWFLDHYRALGVGHFFIVDNGSVDGTFERLRGESDVSLFSNRESFARSNYGTLWINHLIQRFGLGRWCFHVDSDEAFVFPDAGGARTLRDLLTYCDRYGFQAVPAVELDMYPERLDQAPDDNRFAANRLFDSDYVDVRSELPPYFMTQGGIRKRLIGLAAAMQKTPLIKATANARFVNCNHGTTHLKVADVRAALLHYKFVGDSAARFHDAVTRGEHFAGAVSYRRLNVAIASAASQGSLRSTHSHVYEGPSSLENRGIIVASPAWHSFDVSPNGAAHNR